MIWRKNIAQATGNVNALLLWNSLNYQRLSQSIILAVETGHFITDKVRR